jgi:hypothetical protein
VFVNGFDLEAVEAVCATETIATADIADVIGSLVNKSLVIADHSATALRYQLLETIRQFAANELMQIDGQDEVETLRSRHADHYLELCEEAGPSLRAGPRQVAWAHRLALEWDNVMATIEFFGSSKCHAMKVMRICAAATELFMLQGYREPIPYLEAAIELAPEATPSLKGRSLFALAVMNHFESVEGGRLNEKFRASLAMFEGVKSLAEQAGDDLLLVSALTWMASRNLDLGEIEQSQRWAQEALDLSIVLGNANSIGWSQWVLSVGLPLEQRMVPLTASRKSFASAQNLRGLGATLEFMAPAMLSIGGTYSEARLLLEDSISVAEELEVSVLRRRLVSLSIYAIYDGDVDASKRLARRALVIWRRERRTDSDALEELYTLSLCAVYEADYARAAQLWTVWADLLAEQPVNHWIWSPQEAAFRDESLAFLSEALGSSELARQQILGRQMSFGQAVDLALGRSDP